MGYRDQPFHQRFDKMGDEAEGVYAKIKPFGKTIRFGWNRPKGIEFKKLPQILRHKPDFYAEDGYLVEVVGLGKDGILKSIKVEKYEALKTWARIARLLDLELAFFIWNSSKNQYALLTWKKLTVLTRRSANKLGIQAFANDGNEYYPIPWEWILEAASWVEEHGEED